MRNVREILRLRWSTGLSQRRIARSLGLSPSTVCECVQRATCSGLSWPLPEGVDDTQLERLLYPVPAASGGPRPLPNWAQVHRELRRKGVTLQLLWQEYREAFPEDGLGYSRYCDLFRAYESRLDVVMRQEHRAGEKMFVDYSGDGIDIVDRRTGAIRTASLFVAVLGASSYTFAEATETQQMSDWISSHIHAYEFFEGVAVITVPDNPRTAVTRPCRYEPEIHRTYDELGQHYNSVIIPARPRKPRDKAKAEAGVLLAQRWILAALRNHIIHSLVEANQLILGLLTRLNDRPFRKLEGSRRAMFESIDRPALQPLPARRFEITDWRKARVNIDYHVDVEGHYYSVPFGLVKELVDVCITREMVELLHKGRRVASHARDRAKGRHSTHPDHMPRAHRAHLEWTPSRLIDWGATVGQATAELITHILESRRHPEQGYRSCLGLLRLGKAYSTERLESACQRALHFETLSYQSVKSILATGLDREALPDRSRPAPSLPAHDNIRGPQYYQEETPDAQRTDS